MSNFRFLSTEWNEIHAAAIKAESMAIPDHGIVDVGLLHESPFTDISPTGPDALFTSAQVDRIMQLLQQIKSTALAV